MEDIGLHIFLILLFIGVAVNIFALPGPIIIMATVIIYAIITGFSSLGAVSLITMFILAVLAEGVDYFLGTKGAATFPLSRRSLAMGALFGTAGALVLTPVLYGPGLILGFFVGGAGGVFLVDILRMGRFRPSLRSYRASFLGLGAVLSRGGIAMIMTAITLNAIYS